MGKNVKTMLLIKIHWQKTEWPSALPEGRGRLAKANPITVDDAMYYEIVGWEDAMKRIRHSQRRRFQHGAVFFSALLACFFSSCRQEEDFYSNVLRSDVFVQLYDETKYDFLWVVDNSGSMKTRREYVRDHMQTFLNILNGRKAVDYQMAIVTTDFFSHNGVLVQTPGGKEVVKSAGAANPVADFAELMNSVEDSPTSFWEQGLESAYTAVNEHRAKFSRNGIPLIVVFLTDEEDWSCKDNCYGVEPENNPDWIPWEVSRYITFFKEVKASENADVHVFPIVGLDATTCTVASLGKRYSEVLEGVGGFGRGGSICTSELAKSYAGIAQVIADRGVIFPLAASASGRGINVFVNGELLPYTPDTYTYDKPSNSIVFTGAAPKKGSLLEVLYQEKVD